MHMMSEVDLPTEEQETITVSKKPTTVLTANGTTRTTDQATLHVKDSGQFCFCPTPQGFGFPFFVRPFCLSPVCCQRGPLQYRHAIETPLIQPFSKKWGLHQDHNFTILAAARTVVTQCLPVNQVPSITAQFSRILHLCGHPEHHQTQFSPMFWSTLNTASTP